MFSDTGLEGCALCGATDTAPNPHASDCPWRMAVELVKELDG